MRGADGLLVSVLRSPDRIRSLGARRWDLLVRQARTADLLGRVAALAEAPDIAPRVPEPVRPHLDSARVLATRHAEAVRWEVDRIVFALRHGGFPVVLLKGAAYVMTALPPARGRMFYDVDIMVPKGSLPDVEQVLWRHGWMNTHLDAYDQRYYREWMHELPPLRHGRRGTTLDVHHTILPETARLRPDPARLLAAARPVEGYEELYVLAPADMVLHSATHLFHDGELEHGLRDLVDLDGLLRHFGTRSEFWAELTARAAELDLARPLYYALRYVGCMLGTPVPRDVIPSISASGPAGVLRPGMDALFGRALRPDHPSCDDVLTPVARWMLYVRSHYLRMPLHLLLPHLYRKARRRGAA